MICMIVVLFGDDLCDLLVSLPCVLVADGCVGQTFWICVRPPARAIFPDVLREVLRPKGFFTYKQNKI